MFQRLTSKNLFRFSGYGVGDYGLNLFWNSLQLLLLYWYTNVALISPVAAGLIFLIAAVWDMISDPLTAAIAEQTQTRWGSYRPFVLFGGVLLAASFSLVMWVPPFSGLAQFAMLLLAHLIFRTAYTIVSLPYSALTTRISSESRDRTLISGLRMFFAFLGLLTVSAFAFPIVRYFGDGTDTSEAGFQTFAFMCGALAILAFAITFVTTKEKPLRKAQPTRRLSLLLKDMLAYARQNPAMHTMLAILFFHGCAIHIFSSTLALYVDADASVTRSKEAVLGAKGIVTFAMVPVWTLMAHRLGKRSTWIVAASVSAIAGAHLAIFGPTLISGHVVQILMIAACNSGFAIVIWSMLPDVIEYGEATTGVRSEASVYGVASLVQKLAIGIGALIVGAILQSIGFAPDQPAATTDMVSNGVRFTIGLAPSIFWTISIVMVLRHPITRASFDAAVASLNKTEK